MRPLVAVERFLERLFERPSARFFRARVHPVQIEHRMQRAMEAGRRVETGRMFAPDRFTIRLHPADLATVSGSGSVDDLPVALASGALEFARRRGYILAARPRVAVMADVGGHPGEIDVEARFSERAGGARDDEAPHEIARTRVFEVPGPRGPRTELHVSEPRRGPRTVEILGGTLTVGRDASNDLVLADPRASRHHARLTSRGGVLVLTDLESTNGTRVNGRTVREVAVGQDDRIEIGETLLTVSGVPTGGPASPSPRTSDRG
ncbi:MAG: domain containing protein [Chloroflexi bacterium]|nr:domain containing protein [Chloroflexota bacterium]